MKSWLIIIVSVFFHMVPSGRAADTGWRPLWDGKSLDGWHVIGKGDWKIVDGAIRGSHLASENEFGHLVSDRPFTNFIVRLRYKAVRGNSGLYFRSAEKGFSGITGFQAEIDPDKDAGGLYETNGRAWVAQPSPEDVRRWYRPNEWNTMTVRAEGSNVTVRVNGEVSAEIKNDPGSRSGHFALQVHGGQDVEVWFKDIAVRELPGL